MVSPKILLPILYTMCMETEKEPKQTTLKFCAYQKKPIKYNYW